MSTSKTQISKEVNAVLEKESNKFAGFGRAKDAYNYFSDHYPKLAKLVTYDNFHYYWTKKFPSAKLAAKKAAFDVPKAFKPKTEAPVDIDALKEEEHVEIKIFNAEVDEAQDEIFVPFKVGKGLDVIISREGGVMPGTTNVIFADGGVGKSTIAFDTLYSIQANYPKAECMALSSEMSRVDLHAEIKQGKDWMKKVKQVLLDDYKPEQYKSVLRSVLLHGYDFLVIDSFQSILEKLQDKCYMNRNESKNFMLDLIKQSNEGKTKTGKYTAIFLIQQVNKDGNFVGANSLKHDTTGMMYAKFDEHGDRYLVYIKNRRNGDAVHKRLYFSLDKKSEVVYDINRYNEDREREAVARKTKEELDASKDHFNAIFMKGGKAKAQPEEEEDDMLMDEIGGD